VYTGSIVIEGEPDLAFGRGREGLHILHLAGKLVDILNTRIPITGAVRSWRRRFSMGAAMSWWCSTIWRKRTKAFTTRW